ncbi:integrase family protein [Spongiibacter sp. KMU-166]|uniref:Integrase family protein n=1 Tax=Spongiibacter thalassae TaxID=2721624 RepID=A0ABX1GCL1_9GAMM|nr:integrase family protein [Spongiibacter thalassae]NKI16885.1 integrase family protein [Spongiibacter thalassae]
MEKIVNFTAKRVSEFSCPPGKFQEIFWDADPKAPGLGVRIRGKGRPTYVFQSRFQKRSLRMAIGTIDTWTIPEARRRARELQSLIDLGRDPRVVKAETITNDIQARALSKLEGMTVGEAWQTYLEERRPFWSESHYNSHLALSQAGGARRKRSKELTRQGPLYPLLGLKLVDVDSGSLKTWAAQEAKVRPSSSRLALRVFKAFLRWCAEQEGYRGKVDAEAASGKRINEIVGSAPARRDALRREQLAEWFNHVREIQNPVVSGYLQCLLLTGVRREEMAKLKWSDVDFRWHTIHFSDKVDEFGKEIPLTPYVESILLSLPRRNEWVFSSPTSRSGRIVDPKKAHQTACARAGVSLTIHGLRRSFKSLAEWLDIPAGVTAQIMGHKPSATAEKHYTVRPVDLLRVHHTAFESWVLNNAGVEFEPNNEKPTLKAVSQR